MGRGAEGNEGDDAADDDDGEDADDADAWVEWVDFYRFFLWDRADCGVVMDHNRSEEDEPMDVDEDPSKKKIASSKKDELAQYNLDDYDDDIKTTGMQAAANIICPDT
jgi:periodic tryptophan protein 1